MGSAKQNPILTAPPTPAEDNALLLSMVLWVLQSTVDPGAKVSGKLS